MTLKQVQESLRQKVHHSHPQDLSQAFADYACVALLLRGPLDNLELGFIVRAQNPNDRWSGQIAFPGGRREQSDANDIHTAMRETFEEIGVDLRLEDLLGKLSDVQARKGRQMLEFYIRPFVFYVTENFTPNLDPHEVAEFFWHPLTELIAVAKHAIHEVEFNGAKVKLPAVEMNRTAKLWGLSYLMTQDLLKTLA